MPLGRNHDFWVDFRRVCVTAKPDVWTFGELVLPADIQASYADSLGGSLDFLLCQALRSTFATETWELSQFAGFLDSHYRYFPEGHSLPSFVDNHDMDRFFTVADEDLKAPKTRPSLSSISFPGRRSSITGRKCPCHRIN